MVARKVSGRKQQLFIMSRFALVGLIPKIKHVKHANTILNTRIAMEWNMNRNIYTRGNLMIAKKVFGQKAQNGIKRDLILTLI